MRSLVLLLFLLASVKLTAQIDSTSVNRKKLTSIILAESAFYVGGISYLQFVWYRDSERVPFHWYNDAKGYQQIDKMGHFFGSYLESYIGYHWLKSANVKEKNALLYGGMLGLVLQTPIEVFDGLYDDFGFSWPDMAFNALGSGFLIGQQLLWEEQLIKPKFSFYRSELSEKAPGKLGDSFLESLFLDYNGHTYWFSLPLNRIIPKSNLPPWLCISVGYSAEGMLGEFDNPAFYKGKQLPEARRYRQYLLSLDIDLTKIPTRSKFLKGLFNTSFFLKIPFPAIEYNSEGSWKGYGFYY